jgi:hypothetical protein
MMVSRRRLVRIKRRYPRALGPWVLDSGGFSELSLLGEWTVSPGAYVAEVRRYAEEVGQMEWAAPQDWMCEPAMIAKTGLSVAEHQRRTVENVLELRALAPDLPIIPVLQGWALADYLRCVERYDAAGLDLTAEPVVGVGSVCRRQASSEIALIARALSDLGIRCHGFGVKTSAAHYAHLLTSADSMAWSFNARMHPPMAGCSHGKEGRGSCAHCPRWALRWRERLLRRTAHQQLSFDWR